MTSTRSEHALSGTETVDGLRGIAILLVVTFHMWLFSWVTPSLVLFGINLPVEAPAAAGFMGVDLFFVISGFCLYLPYARAARGDATAPGLRAFAYRRFIKIYPSFLVALVVALALAGLKTPLELWNAFVTHAFFIHNSFYDPMGRVNSVFWSLAVEVQFYLIFPALALAFRRSPILTALVMIVSAELYRAWGAGCCLEDERITRQLPAFLDLFAFGMLAAWALVTLRARPAPVRRTWIATLTAVAAAGLMYYALACVPDASLSQDPMLHWVATYRGLFGLDAGILIVASCCAADWWRRLLANPVLVFLSVVSYNLYLWHTMVAIWLAEHHVPPFKGTVDHDDVAWRMPYLIIALVAELAVATALTYFFERPLLTTVKPHPFAFDWKALARRAGRKAPTPQTNLSASP